MNLSKSGTFGMAASILGIGLLIFTFVMAYTLLTNQPAVSTTDLTSSMGTLLFAGIEVMFLGIMGWVGSLMLLRGIEFMRVERGVGAVTFRVDKGVGVVTQSEEKQAESKGS